MYLRIYGFWEIKSGFVFEEFMDIIENLQVKFFEFIIVLFIIIFCKFEFGKFYFFQTLHIYCLLKD